MWWLSEKLWWLTAGPFVAATTKRPAASVRRGGLLRAGAHPTFRIDPAPTLTTLPRRLGHTSKARRRPRQTARNPQLIRAAALTFPQVALQFHPAYPAKPLPAMSSDNVVAAPGAVYKRATETAQFLKENVPAELRSPKVAIVCGSGLGGLAETIHKEPVYATPYANIPNFPQSTGA